MKNDGDRMGMIIKISLLGTCIVKKIGSYGSKRHLIKLLKEDRFFVFCLAGKQPVYAA